MDFKSNHVWFIFGTNKGHVTKIINTSYRSHPEFRSANVIEMKSWKSQWKNWKILLVIQSHLFFHSTLLPSTPTTHHTDHLGVSAIITDFATIAKCCWNFTKTHSEGFCIGVFWVVVLSSGSLAGFVKQTWKTCLKLRTALQCVVIVRSEHTKYPSSLPTMIKNRDYEIETIYLWSSLYLAISFCLTLLKTFTMWHNLLLF